MAFLFKTAEEYVKALSEANAAYYDHAKPTMSDKQFDTLRDEFVTRFPKHEFVQKVGGEAKNLFKPTAHKIPMGSQDKANSFEELTHWLKNTVLKKVAEVKTLFISEKLDGSSLSVEYVNGKLVAAITRGDGQIGENVTFNALKIPSIPNELANPISVTLRGEVMLKKSVFEKFFTDMVNPRNTIAGLLGRKDGERCEHLEFLAYDILSGDEFSTEEEKFAAIKHLGFQTPNHFTVSSIEGVQAIWLEYENGKRLALDYELDGLIVAINEIKDQINLGIINNRPRFSRAYKFSAMRDQTTLIDIHWFAGRTGRITPVGEVIPVFLAGVTIQNITLHNLAEIKRLGVKIGSLVEIKRAGDVIPKIESVLNDEGTPVQIPHECPSCKHQVVEEEVFLMCYNQDCPAKNFENLLHWVKSLDIKGFGDKLVEQLISAGMVKEPRDFYLLKAENLIELERMGETLAQKILQELHSKKAITYGKFIQGLGIPNFSEKRAMLLESSYPSVEDLLKATSEDIAEIKGFDFLTAEAVVNGLQQKLPVIRNLLEVVTIKQMEITSQALNGQSFCFTKVRDKELEKRIVSAGGKIASGVSSNLTYLVTKDPEDTSSKLAKARELGVKIISLEEAQGMI